MEIQALLYIITVAFCTLFQHKGCNVPSYVDCNPQQRWSTGEPLRATVNMGWCRLSLGYLQCDQGSSHSTPV